MNEVHSNIKQYMDWKARFLQLPAHTSHADGIRELEN